MLLCFIILSKTGQSVQKSSWLFLESHNKYSYFHKVLMEETNGIFAAKNDKVKKISTRRRWLFLC